MTSRGVEQPPSVTAATSAPLQTPLQSQICAVSGRSAGPASDASASACSGSSIGSPERTAATSASEPRVLPSRIAPTTRPLRVDELAVDAGGGVGHDGLVLALGSPAQTRSMPATLSFALGTEPR